MAKPRIFISSTYYDLRSVRDDLDRFIRSLGFEPVRHERGHISYGHDAKPEEYAYREIDLCEILICIIGGKFGSSSAHGSYSITQKELKTAIDRGKQVYIFIEESVHHEYRYFLANKSLSGVKYTAVDNIKVHEFIEEIYTLPSSNPIFSFGVSSDINNILQEQWAGLFQRLLIEHSLKSQTELVQELQRSLQTVGQLVEFLTEEKGKGNQAIQEILFANHPIFEALRKLTNNRYRIYFTNLLELDQWLKSARSFEKIPSDMEDFSDFFEWQRVYENKTKHEFQTLYIKKSLFDKEEKLIPSTASTWDDSWIKMKKTTPTKSSNTSWDDLTDEIPF